MKFQPKRGTGDRVDIPYQNERGTVPPKMKNRIGKVQGKLTVTHFAGWQHKGGFPVGVWACLCNCGKDAYVRQDHLLTVGSCGCDYGKGKIQGPKEYATVARAKAKRALAGAISRCHNPEANYRADCRRAIAD